MFNYTEHKVYRKFVRAIVTFTFLIFLCLRIFNNCLEIEWDEEQKDGNREGMNDEVVC